MYSTGYTANSATLQAMLKKEDLAILDMAVHASVYEGCLTTNVKSFPHNNLDALERIEREPPVPCEHQAIPKTNIINPVGTSRAKC
ncbi:hypothetical protein [Parapedobacter sp. 2B3]|uniref:hypothetical protein n=1 Tax=Parapedobacter sp. 2B3 TaxID=3342381 RepID=UPI0035B692E9